jgi:MFS family permease
MGIPFVGVSLARDVFPKKLRSVAMALVATGAGALSIATSFATKPIIEQFGWQGVIWVPALYALVVAIIVSMFVPESSIRARNEGFDLLGVFLLAVAITCLLIPISIGDSLGWTSPLVLSLFIAGAILLAVWVPQALRTESPVIAIREFKYFPLLCAFIFAFVGQPATIALFSFWGFVIATPPEAGLGYGLGMNAGDVGLATAIYSVGSFLGGFSAGRAINKRWPGVVAMAIFGLLAVSYVLVAFSLSTPLAFFVGVILLGLAGGGGYAFFYNLVALSVPAERQAASAAAINVSLNIGGAVFPVVMFAILNANATVVEGGLTYPLEWMQFAFLVPVALSVLLVILGAALVRYQRRNGGRLRDVDVPVSPVELDFRDIKQPLDGGNRP